MTTTLLLLVRAITLACPLCGARPIFRRWLFMREACPGCRLEFTREEGYWTGAMAINLVAAELSFVAILVGVVLALWPTPPWDLLRYGAMVGMALFPIVFYPVSRMLWLALDLILHPLPDRAVEGPARRSRPDDRRGH